MRTLVAGVAIGLINTVACSKSESEQPKPTSSAAGIEIPAGLPPLQREATERGRDALVTACAAQPIEWSEFQSASITTGRASGYLRDHFDWDMMVTISLTYKEGLDQRRGGHRLEFNMGAGKRPGIVTRKSHGIKLCGFERRAKGVSSGEPCDPEGGEDCILDVPGLQQLDAARSPAVVNSDRTAPSAWCFSHGFDSPHFWTCRATERDCKKARAIKKQEENGDSKVRSECTQTATLHCFTIEGGKTVCAIDAEACATSRAEWTINNTATPCDIATREMLVAASRKNE